MLLSQPTNGIHSHQMVCDVIHCLYNNTQPASVTKIPLWLNGHSTGVSVGNWDRPATHSGYKARVTRHSSIWMKWVCFEYFNVLYWVIQIKCVDTAFKDLMEFSKCGFLDKFKKKKIFKLYDRKLSIKINRSRKCREIHLVYHFFCLYEIHTLQLCYSCTRALGAQSESLISASGSRSSTGSPLSQLHTEICGHVSVSPPVLQLFPWDLTIIPQAYRSMLLLHMPYCLTELSDWFRLWETSTRVRPTHWYGNVGL